MNQLFFIPFPFPLVNSHHMKDPRVVGPITTSEMVYAPEQEICRILEIMLSGVSTSNLSSLLFPLFLRQ